MEGLNAAVIILMTENKSLSSHMSILPESRDCPPEAVRSRPTLLGFQGDSFGIKSQSDFNWPYAASSLSLRQRQVKWTTNEGRRWRTTAYPKGADVVNKERLSERERERERRERERERERAGVGKERESEWVSEWVSECSDAVSACEWVRVSDTRDVSEWVREWERVVSGVSEWERSEWEESEWVGEERCVSEWVEEWWVSACACEWGVRAWVRSESEWWVRREWVVVREEREWVVESESEWERGEWVSEWVSEREREREREGKWHDHHCGRLLKYSYHSLFISLRAILEGILHICIISKASLFLSLFYQCSEQTNSVQSANTWREVHLSSTLMSTFLVRGWL